MNQEMIISAIAPWFGGKRTLAPEIIQELGRHRAFWEPFCGSMAVLLSKPESPFETVNDLHGDLVNLARCIRHPKIGPSLYRRLRRVMLSESLFDESGDVIRQQQQFPVVMLDANEPGNISDTAHCHEDRAYHYFITSWFGRNGVAGTSSYNSHFCRRFTKNGGHAATRWESVVSSIPAWRRRLRRVTILAADGISLCERIEDADGVVIYADPPYLKKGAKYLHDFDWLAHRRLATALQRFKKTRVVVSYYDHPDLAQLYPGWTVRALDATKALVSAGQRDQSGKAEKAPEVLLINGPSYVQEAA